MKNFKSITKFLWHLRQQSLKIYGMFNMLVNTLLEILVEKLCDHQSTQGLQSFLYNKSQKLLALKNLICQTLLTRSSTKEFLISKLL